MNRRDSFKAAVVGLLGALWPWGARAASREDSFECSITMVGGSPPIDIMIYRGGRMVVSVAGKQWAEQLRTYEVLANGRPVRREVPRGDWTVFADGPSSICLRVVDFERGAIHVDWIALVEKRMT